MAKRDILKEAIADAKTVKDTAIANAKAALEEAFTPQLKSMLAAKLEEMELDEEKEEVEEMSDPVMRHGLKGDDKEEIETEKMREEKEDMDEEINLDEILAELEEEMDDDKEDIKEDARTDAEEEGYEDGMEDEKEDMEDEEIDLEDMTDEDLKGFIEDVIADMVSSGELEAGENFEEEDVEVEDEVDVDVDSEEEVEITEEMKDEDSMEEVVTSRADQGAAAGMAELAKMVRKLYAKAATVPPAIKKKIGDLLGDLEPASPLQKKLRDAGTGKMQSFQSRYESLEREINLVLELQEAQSEIKTLKSTVKVKNEALNEVNLLNAKLLYTNKIFRAKTLTESQKVKVLGAFDKAGTVKETKLVFETLNEGLKTKKTSIRESLGSASKSTGNFKSTKKPIVETDPMVARFQKLAGIK